MAIRQIGSQNRETLEDAGLRLVAGMDDGEVILADGDKRELWQRNDHFAGYVVEIDGVGYEFVRSLP